MCEYFSILKTRSCGQFSTALENRKAIAVLSLDYLKNARCISYEFALMPSKITNKKASSSIVLVIKYKNRQLPKEMKSIKCIDYTKAYKENQKVVIKILGYFYLYQNHRLQ